MKKQIIVLIPLIGLLTTVWANEKTTLDIDNAIQRIPAIERSYIYSNMKNTIINSEKELISFLDDRKTDYLSKVLKNEKIDFTKSNLMIYLHTETAGSLKVFPIKSRIDADNNVTINIDIKSDFDMTSNDMAYYGFIYKIDKSIKQVTFDNFLDGVVMNPPSTITEIGLYSEFK